nr:hypothetical protein [Halorubrum lacusprofundi]
MSKTKQADGEIHEDQLLNFLVNRLDEVPSILSTSQSRLVRTSAC